MLSGLPFFLLIFFQISLDAQAPAEIEPVTLSGTPGRVLEDQGRIWTSPQRLKLPDLRWLLPVSTATGLLIGTDRHTNSLIHSNTQIVNRGNLFANAGVAAFGATALGFYVVGAKSASPHMRETGLLVGEALLNSYAFAEAIKVVTSRERPDESPGGAFWRSSSPLSSSFPSEHSILAWTAATVIAQEYPGPVSKWSAYGLAAAVSAARVISQEHFSSDVFVGAAAGVLIGRLVYRAHHDRELDERFGSTPVRQRSPLPPQIGDSDRRSRIHGARGSVYVPLDSWIYPALRRLAALGYIPEQDSLIAPWTRKECLRQIRAAEDIATRRDTIRKAGPVNEEALRFISSLQSEFRDELDEREQLKLESVYTITTGISGKPLRDSFHFGQTIANDLGRPYDEGVSNSTGFSAYADSGPIFAYFRGEYQYAPGRGSYTPEVLDFISRSDTIPVSALPTPDTSRFKPLEMYAGVALGKFQITFGKQSLWWGPGEASAMHFSNNAEPFYTFRIAQTEAFVLPWFFRYLGRIRTEAIFGKLSGHEFPPRPFINAQKATFQLTDDLELGFTASTVFGGVGHPLTFGSFGRSIFSFTSTGTGVYGDRADPGDRRSGFDFRWRIPGLQRRLTIYSDSLADDEPNPIDNPRRAAWAPGLYLSQLPWLDKMDFRLETYSTLLYRGDVGGSFIYINNQYVDGYTNRGYLLGSWIGRDSRAYIASSAYWFSSQSTVKAQYKQIKAGALFLPGGGTQTDVSLAGQWRVRPDWQLTALLQYERYNIPVLSPVERDVTARVGITFYPENLKLRR